MWLWTILLRGESARPYNVGSGEALTIADLARAVADATEPKVNIRIAKEAVAGRPAVRYVPNVDRAAAELGLLASIPLDEGIRRTCDWTTGLYNS